MARAALPASCFAAPALACIPPPDDAEQIRTTARDLAAGGRVHVPDDRAMVHTAQFPLPDGQPETVAVIREIKVRGVQCTRVQEPGPRTLSRG